MSRPRACATTIASLLAVLAVSSTSRADQPADDGAPPAPPTVEPSPPAPPTVGPSPPTAAAAPDPAWQGYDDAFVELGKGKSDAAHDSLLQLTTRWPEHPATALALHRLADLEARGQARAARSASRVARGEVVFWSTLGSVFVASNLCIDNCASDRASAAVYSLTIGAGLGLSLVLTRHGLEPAEAQLYNSAQTWGSWNALARNDGFAEDNTEAAFAIGAQVAGLAAGVGLWRSWHPDPGEVALANSGLVWGAVLSAYGHLMFDADTDHELQTVVLLGDLGLVAGALIAHEVPMSRGRTLLIDLGGVLGTLAGGLVVISGDDDQTAGTTLFVTTAAGLVIAGFATRGWDVEPPRSLRVVPARLGTPGTGTSWGAALAFDL